MSEQQQPKYHSTGRGGAGNMVAGDAPEPRSQRSLEEEIPKIDEGNYYTTGRGGLGNMRQNVDSEIARKAQDISVEHGLEPMASNGSVGRGGYGNHLRRQASNTPEGRRQGSNPPEGRTAEEQRKPKSFVERAKQFFSS